MFVGCVLLWVIVRYCALLCYDVFFVWPDARAYMRVCALVHACLLMCVHVYGGVSVCCAVCVGY